MLDKEQSEKQGGRQKQKLSQACWRSRPITDRGCVHRKRGKNTLSFSSAEIESFVDIDLSSTINLSMEIMVILGRWTKDTVLQVATSPEVDFRSISMLMDQAAVDYDRRNQVVSVKIVGANESGA